MEVLILDSDKVTTLSPLGHFTGFVNNFLRVPLACLPGQQGSCITTKELSEDILQNLGNDLMTDSV